MYDGESARQIGLLNKENNADATGDDWHKNYWSQEDGVGNLPLCPDDSFNVDVDNVTYVNPDKTHRDIKKSRLLCGYATMGESKSAPGHFMVFLCVLYMYSI